MPISLWGDDDGSRCARATSTIYPGVWRHGDWIEITERGTAIIYGRSDSTINRGGIRMGTSEIYRAVLGRSTTWSTRSSSTSRARAPTAGCRSSWSCARARARRRARRRDQRRIREDCSPRHVPDEVHQIAEVPRTLSGKVARGPGQADPHGPPADEVASRDSLANPDALDDFVGLAAGAQGSGVDRYHRAREVAERAVWPLSASAGAARG